MKSEMKMAVAGLLVMAAMQSCQLVTGAIDIAREVKGFPVEVKLNDGTLLAGEAKMPNGRTKTVTVKEADGTKHKLDSEDIAYLTAWSEKAPDSRFTLVYKGKRWMVPKSVGRYLAVFAQSGDFYIGKDGTMHVTGTQIHYYGFRPGEEEGTLIAHTDYSKKQARKSVTAYLSDDPDLCRAIEAKEIDPFDFDTICAEYNPGQ